MKNIKLSIVLLFLLLSVNLVGQKDFKWDIIIDSLENNKQELYSTTKLFISETWKSAKDVVQNDDKDAGLILIKALSIQSLSFQMNNHTWTYSYTVKFYMKDGKCRIIIDDVHCSSGRCGSYEWPHMPVAERYPEKKGLKITGVNEDRYLLLMSMLKTELNGIVYLYIAKLSKPQVIDSDW